MGLLKDTQKKQRLSFICEHNCNDHSALQGLLQVVQVGSSRGFRVEGFGVFQVFKAESRKGSKGLGFRV